MENTYSIKIHKGKRRASLSFPSDAVINVRGSKPEDGGFYHLQEQIFNEIMNNANRYFVVIFGSPET